MPGKFKPVNAFEISQHHHELLQVARGMDVAPHLIEHLRDNTKNALLKPHLPDHAAQDLERHGLISKKAGGWVTTDLGRAILHKHGG